MTSTVSGDCDIADTKPLRSGWPRESIVVPLIRAVRVGLNTISMPLAV